MKKLIEWTLVALAGAGGAVQALAAVSADDAAKLKTTLTPLGAERAGNADGSIPAWTGGYTSPIPGDKPGGRRGDPFKDEKPILSINAKNVDQHAAKLTDGTVAMLKKYPDTYRVDVYKTHRTAVAPQYVYDNTLKNATRASMDGVLVKGAYAGIPFPIPKTGAEVMWNHMLRWRGVSYQFPANQYVITPEGKAVLSNSSAADAEVPYYYQDGSLEAFEKNGDYWLLRMVTSGPPIRAGEAITSRVAVDGDKSQTWVYLTGQRRVRKLANPCCDTPNPGAAGVMSIDELQVWSDRLDRFDWKLLSKQEMYIPYNGNRQLQPTKDADVLVKQHMNPDVQRWELHRVWVVEATLLPGQRHQIQRSRYYCDEDTWQCVLADRWDAKGQLWKTLWANTFVAPDVPGTIMGAWGYSDLLSGAGFVGDLFNQQAAQLPTVRRFPASHFTPDAMASGGVR